MHGFVERLRKEAIGKPRWISAKEVFEYEEQSLKVVAILKIIRAAQGVTALNLLCRSGLFIDFGVTIRCIYESIMEVYFLLEDFPNSSTHVEKFVNSFFQTTIDDDPSQAGSAVPTNKIRSAMVRALKGTHDHATTQNIDRIYQTFSGYVHSNYAHIMEIYGGARDDFNLIGVPPTGHQIWRFAYLDVAADTVLHATTFAAQKFGLSDLSRDIVASWQED